MTGRPAGDAIELAESIGIGLAISVPDGLVAPIIKDVNKNEMIWGFLFEFIYYTCFIHNLYIMFIINQFLINHPLKVVNFYPSH